MAQNYNALIKYLVLFSRKSDIDIFGIVPPPAKLEFATSPVSDDGIPVLVTVGSRTFPYKSDVLIRLKLRR